MRDKWAEEILKRFEGREDLGAKGLYEKYFKHQGLKESDVMECFEVIVFFYPIPIGFLRPIDSMNRLTKAVSTNNPLKWLFWRSRSEFSEGDLYEDLDSKLLEHGTLDDWEKIIVTFNDFVLAWCGKKPFNKKS